MSNKRLSLGALEYLNGNFTSRRCPGCGSHFWAREEQDTCGDAPCAPYTFIGAPVLKKRTLNDMREFYLSFFEHRGHTRVHPYPVIARWREDVLLVNASIYDFQPLVTSGKVPPPANPLTISQPCVRLKDIDVVGKSGRHLTNFEMMAHHAFNYPSCHVYWSSETVEYCDSLLQKLGANLASITYKERPWAGGGNAGISLEVLIGGLELATLVFMDLERSKTGIAIKGEHFAHMENSIVDTGYGLERMVWASNGMPTVYDAVMPEVVNFLVECAGLEHSLEDSHYSHVLAQNARLSGLVDLSAANLLDLRKRLAKNIGISVEELIRTVEPIETIYTIADHSRCLVFMLGDGIVPSNVKAGYLARLVIRKVLRLMQGLGCASSLEDIVAQHIQYLSAFPAYAARAGIIADMILRESEKYESTMEKGRRRVATVAQRYKGQNIPTDEVIKMYDSHGIPPELIEEVATQSGARVQVPDDFYSLVAASHERVEIAAGPAPKADRDLPATYRLFYDEPEAVTFEAKVVGLTNDGLILDRTLFYPGGGGQPEDTGYVTSRSGTKVRVRLARLQGQAIIHELEDEAPFSIGDQIQGEIDVDRRRSLARHHTATHILLAAIRNVLGDHIWQEGAQKGEESSRLDVSHYKKVTDEQRREIELRANQSIMDDTAVQQRWMERNEAEQKYGFALYQGGVPPGATIRVVQVGDDVQACAGTHVTRTGKIGSLRIIKTERIQDGVERFEFAAGIAAITYGQGRDKIVHDSAQEFGVSAEQLPAAAHRFFQEWKLRQKRTEELAAAAARAIPVTVQIVDTMERGGHSINVFHSSMDADMKESLRASKELLSKNDVVILGGARADRANIVIMASTDLVRQGLDAALIVKEACKVLGGNGGGRPDRAQGAGPQVDKINDAVNAALKLARGKLGSIGYK